MIYIRAQTIVLWSGPLSRSSTIHHPDAKRTGESVTAVTPVIGTIQACLDILWPREMTCIPGQWRVAGL